MLYKRQYMHHHVGGAVVLPETQTLENGCSEVVRVNQADFILPDVSSTKLSRLLEAGVDLKQVPSKVVASDDDINIQIGSAEPENNKE